MENDKNQASGLIQIRRSKFRADFRIPRSYDIKAVQRILGMNRTRFHLHFKKFVRRYGRARNPLYNADDVEALARVLAWFNKLKYEGRIPAHISAQSVITRLQPPEDFKPAFIEDFKQYSIPPSYLIAGAVKKLGYYDRRNLYRSGLLQLVRTYRTKYRRVYDAAEVEMLARAVRAFEEQRAFGLTDRNRKAWIAERFRQAKQAREAELERRLREASQSKVASS